MPSNHTNGFQVLGAQSIVAAAAAEEDAADFVFRQLQCSSLHTYSNSVPWQICRKPCMCNFHFSTVHSVQYWTTLHCSRVIIQAGWQCNRKSSTSRVAMQCNNKWKQGGNAVPWRPVPVTPAAAVHRDSVYPDKWLFNPFPDPRMKFKLIILHLFDTSFPLLTWEGVVVDFWLHT